MELFVKINQDTSLDEDGSDYDLKQQDLLVECKDICSNYIDIYEDKQYWETCLQNFQKDNIACVSDFTVS